MGNWGTKRGLNTLLAAAGAAGLIAASATPAQAVVGEIRSAGGADAIAGSYLVVLKQDQESSLVSALAESLAGKHGAAVTHTFGSALHGFVMRGDVTDAMRLAADPEVAYVEQNHRLHITDVQPSPPSWGLDRLDQRDLPLDDSYSYATTAGNVTAYVIDTGVAADHPDFGGRVSGGVDVIDNDGDPDDENGHGTHVAGTIGGATYGVAKGVRIVPVRVLDANGSGTTAQVIAGIDWVAQHASGPSVANMSLGGIVDSALDDAVRGAIDKGVTFGVAAGNDSLDARLSSPARVREAITVAASDNTDRRASFSNWGPAVDLFAPGVDITSTWHDGGTNTISGTSMATPHVVGAAALYLSSHPSASPAQVEDALTSSATADAIANPGLGTPDRLLYTGA